MEEFNEAVYTPEIDELVELSNEAIETISEVQPVEIPNQEFEQAPETTDVPKYSTSVCICGTPMTCTKI